MHASSLANTVYSLESAIATLSMDSGQLAAAAGNETLDICRVGGCVRCVCGGLCSCAHTRVCACVCGSLPPLPVWACSDSRRAQQCTCRNPSHPRCLTSTPFPMGHYVSWRSSLCPGIPSFPNLHPRSSPPSPPPSPPPSLVAGHPSRGHELSSEGHEPAAVPAGPAVRHRWPDVPPVGLLRGRRTVRRADDHRRVPGAGARGRGSQPHGVFGNGAGGATAGGLYKQRPLPRAPFPCPLPLPPAPCPLPPAPAPAPAEWATQRGTVPHMFHAQPRLAP
jgi:hypothetical protein